MNLRIFYRQRKRPMDSWMDSGQVSYLHVLCVDGGGSLMRNQNQEASRSVPEQMTPLAWNPTLKS